MTFDPYSIFSISSEEQFEQTALELFNWQRECNPIYKTFCDHLIKTNEPKTLLEIPFLPIQFFKTHEVTCYNTKPEVIYTSSGTTGSIASKHFVASKKWYLDVTVAAFEVLYGSLSEYRILALLPSYLEREGSSLIDMVEHFIQVSGNEGGFYLNHNAELIEKLREPFEGKTLLIGVTFGLLDFAENHNLELRNTVIMETGGMKGRRKELTRPEVHNQLKNAFHQTKIHSEYGMTELLSQAYSKGDGIFTPPSWMRVLTRDTTDPLAYTSLGKTGGVNVIDLANWQSCAFIQTQDLGKVYSDHSFEIIGRFDDSDVRGCNLMVQ